MVEFKLRDAIYKDNWKELKSARSRTVDEFEFDRVDYRIDGIVYKSQTKEFEAAFNKELVWLRLSNDRI